MSATTPQLRQATESDIEFLADVVLLSVEDRYRRRPGWDRDAFRRGLVEDAADQVAGGPENSVTYVIVADGVDVGRARLVTTDSQVEIAGLQVLPDHQNSGIGTAVVSQVIDQAGAGGLPVVLEVETDNPDAQRLYQRLSFELDGPVVNDRRWMILRPELSGAAWGSDDWRTDAEQWAVDELTALGRTGPSPMADVSAQPWSTVWRIRTDAGDVVVKQTTGPRRREGDVIAFCAEAAPDQVDAHQAAWLHDLPDSDPRHITAEQLARIRTCLPDLEHAGQQVAASPVPYCLDHGDLWPGNVIPAEGRNQFRFIDLGDAAWTHPFVSMIMMVAECRHHWSVPDRTDGLNLDHPVLHQILDTYLNAWTTYAPLDDLRATLHHALRIAPLRRSRAWITNLDQADRESLTDLGQLPWAWLEDVTHPILP